MLLLLACGSTNKKPTRAAVRGAWLTTTDSRVLESRQHIEAALNNCVDLGINTLFVAVWGNGNTNYPSQIMQQLTATPIAPRFAGRDPLKEIIEAAKPKNIKIMAWFEYGFSSSYSANGGAIVRAKPHWAAIGTDKKLVVKNGFDWLNALHPEVQDFMLSLMMEVVQNYDIDGIQGDDRLPAMPSEAGYDDYTTAQYGAENNGQYPPKNTKDAAWIQWRANRLSVFAKKMYDAVKAIKKNAIVSFAPSVFPFGRDEYLQDWTKWLADGSVDLLCPQIYRRDITNYTTTLRQNIALVPKNQRFRFYPGVLIKVGKYQVGEQLLGEMINENRKNNLQGEVFFFYEGLNIYQNAFRKKWYKGATSFPKLTD